MSLLGNLHGRYVHSRRVRVLRDSLSRLLPQNARVLDVGCGDGLLASLIMEQRPDVDICGIDVLVRPDTKIPVKEFDGLHIPYDSKSFDVVMFVDVLHHTDDPAVLLAEASRVAGVTVIKDHRLNGFLAGPTLRFMDWMGNAPHGVVLPYNYWPHEKWQQSFALLNLTVRDWKEDLQLYTKPADWLFGRSLHFVCQLETSADGKTQSNAQ